MRLGFTDCGCDCKKVVGWQPGTGLPTATCPTCGASQIPCEYLAVFAACELNECDGLSTNMGVPRAVGDFSTGTWGSVRLLKDDCLAETGGVCRYTARRYVDGTGTGSAYCSHGGLPGGTVGYLGGGVNALCNGPFEELFPGIKNGEYVMPIYGCDPPGAVSNANRCGWYDFWKMLVCDVTLDSIVDDSRFTLDYVEWLAWLEDCTEIAWELILEDGNLARLRGYTFSGYVVEYTAVATPAGGFPPGGGPGGDVFICDQQNTMRLTTHPDPNCPYLPEYVCVFPSYAQFRTPCEDKDDVTACCDPGMDELNFRLASDDCDSVNGLEICTRRYNNDGYWYDKDGNVGGTLPDELTDYMPVGACGFFYGTVSYTVNSQNRTLVLFAWCSGGDWKYTLLCAATGTPFSDISVLCQNADLTLLECCPYPQFAAIDCAGLTDVSDCCDQTEPLCTQWTVQFFEGSNGNYTLGTGGQVIGFFIPDETRNWTIGATLVAGFDASSGQIHADHADCCSASSLGSFNVATDLVVALTAGQIYIICFFNAVGTNTYSIQIT